MKIKSILLNTAIFFATLSLLQNNTAQAQSSISLTDCLSYGLAHNPGVEKSALETQRSESRVDEVYSGFYPQIKANASLNDNLKLQTSILPGEIFGQPGQMIPVQFGTQYNMTAGIDVNQVLFDPGLLSGLKIANQSIEVSEMSEEFTQEQLLFNIAQSYYSAQITATRKKIIEGNLKNLDTLVMITKVKYENDFILKTDYDRMTINKSNLETEISTLELNLEKQLRLLKYYCGMPIDSAISVGSATDEIEAFELPEYNSASTLDMRLLMMQKELYTMNISLVRSGYIPSLSLGFRYAYQAMRNDMKFFGNSAEWYPMSYLTLNLSVPIFDGFAKHRKVQQLQIDIMKNELDQKSTSAYLDMQYQNALSDLSINNKSLEIQKKNMALAADVYRMTKIQYELNMSSLADLMNAENTLKDAQSNYMAALIRIKIAQLELLKTTGNIKSVLQ
jgi:outer membrane protein